MLNATMSIISHSCWIHPQAIFIFTYSNAPPVIGVGVLSEVSSASIFSTGIWLAVFFTVTLASNSICTGGSYSAMCSSGFVLLCD